VKNALFWDVAHCRSWVNRHFGGKYRLHLQTADWQPPAHAGFSLADFSTLKMEEIPSSETSVQRRLQGAKSQKTAFFIVTAVKNSNLTTR
jgi:hypothetical protein